ncbi:hypothetical protein [Psychrobacter sp. NPDC078929]
MTNHSTNFQEEFSSKIPALTLLNTLSYQFIPKQLLIDKNQVVING